MLSFFIGPSQYIFVPAFPHFLDPRKTGYDMHLLLILTSPIDEYRSTYATIAFTRVESLPESRRALPDYVPSSLYHGVDLQDPGSLLKIVRLLLGYSYGQCEVLFDDTV